MTARTALAATLCLTAAGSAVAGAGGAAARSTSSSLKLGVYDCEAYNYAFGGLSYHGSIKLQSGHRYEGAADRHHATLKKPTHGHYRISGKKVLFRGGSYRNAVGHIVASTTGGSPHIALYYKGKSSGISCYRVKKP